MNPSMNLEFSDAQKQALECFDESSPPEPDVRKWPYKARFDLFYGMHTISLSIATRKTTSATTYPRDYSKKRSFVVATRALIALSPTFAEHFLANLSMDSLIIDVSGMDEKLQLEHDKALSELCGWCSGLAESDLQAPTFYSEIALRHIARQLGMTAYLPRRTEEFAQDAQKHTLHPWQITELLYASSIESNAPLPVIPEDDPLLVYLAQKMNETITSVWPFDKEAMYRWLGEEKHKVLGAAMQRARENKVKKKGTISWEKEKTLQLVKLLGSKIKVG